MDLCGPMRMERINGMRYILVIFDDYSRYMWVYFLRSKDEASEMIKNITRIHVSLRAADRFVRTEIEDLDDLFGPLYIEYFERKTPNVSTSDNFAALDTPHDTSSSTTIIVDVDEAPHIVSTSYEQTPSQSNDITTGSQQEDNARLDGNELINLFSIPVFNEAESSSRNLNPSNMHLFYNRYLMNTNGQKHIHCNRMLGDLGLLRDDDGKSDGGGEDDDGKSDGGGEDDDGKSDGGGEDDDGKSDVRSSPGESSSEGLESRSESAFGWLLEEIHVTLAHLEKKRTRLRLYTKSLKELCTQCVETASQFYSDGVTTFKRQRLDVTASLETLEDSMKRRRQESCDAVATSFSIYTRSF
ncbi:integrase, catalytic region, zinc finger, CCHC-type containing protein [Tanacetum coccineum]